MSTQKLRAIYKQLNDKIDNSKEAAVFEIKELKADLNELQRHLSGRKKTTCIQPDDILRSAYEIAQFLRDIRKREEVLTEMQDVAAGTEAEDYLLSRGAKLLTRPAGWHFQTAKERFLLHEEDVVLAATELRKLLAAGKRLKRPKKKKKPKAESAAAPKAEAKAVGKGKKAKATTAAAKARPPKAGEKAKKAAAKATDVPAASAKPNKPAKAAKPKAAAKPAKKPKAETAAKTKKKKATAKK